MFPHDKQNFVDYRFLFWFSAILFILSVGIGVLWRLSSGWVFAAFQGYAALEAGIAMFRWYPEPTAKRQFATLVVVLAVIGIGGFMLVNWVTETLVVQIDRWAG